MKIENTLQIIIIIIILKNKSDPSLQYFFSLSPNTGTNGHKSAFLFQKSLKLMMTSAPHQYLCVYIVHSRDGGLP